MIFIGFVNKTLYFLDAVCSCLGEFEKIIVHGIGVTEIPKSGKAKDLLEIHGIDHTAIIKKVKEILQSQD